MTDKGRKKEKNHNKKPIHKKWWFWVLAVIIVGSWFTGNDEDSKQPEATEVNKQDDKENEKDSKEKEKNKNKTKDADMNIEIEITQTKISKDNVIVKGSTNIIDGAQLGYQLRATEGFAEVKNGEWEIKESVSGLDKDDENNVYGDGTVYELLVLFPPFGTNEEQDKEILEVYGGPNGLNITGGPNFYESDDKSSKYVSLTVEFDKDGVIDPEVKKEKEYEQAIEDWEKHYKNDMLDHYNDAGIIDIRENPGGDWDVVNVYVPNEFKLYSEEEKVYYVEEIGPLLEGDLTSHFKKDHEIHVYFKYEDGNDMATRKMFGGWKVK